MTDPDPNEIRELAYRLWEARGRRPGHAIDDWLDAERQLKAAQDPVPLTDGTGKRSRKRAKSALPGKPPIAPPDDTATTPPETPKVGSRDAPGG